MHLPSHTAPGATPESILVDLEQKLAQAWMRGDRAFIEDLLDPDWTMTESSGRILSRDRMLDEAFASGTRKIDSMTVDDLKVRMLGTAAVVTGRLDAAGTRQGQPVSTAALRFTDVFYLRDGRWQMVASHDTMIASQETTV